MSSNVRASWPGFTGFIIKASAAGEITGAKALGGFEQNPNLAQNVTFTTKPRCGQSHQADGKTSSRKFGNKHQPPNGHDGQKNRSHQTHAQT
jgi:hypothetical protein